MRIARVRCECPIGFQRNRTLDVSHPSQPVTNIAVTPKKARFVRIRLTAGVGGLYWSIHEMQIYGK